MFSFLLKVNVKFSVTFILSPANAFNLVPSKFLLFCKDLKGAISTASKMSSAFLISTVNTDLFKIVFEMTQKYNSKIIREKTVFWG